MNSTVKSLVLHGVLATIGFVAGAYSNDLSSQQSQAESKNNVLDGGRVVPLLELIHASRNATLLGGESTSFVIEEEGEIEIAGHTS